MDEIDNIIRFEEGGMDADEAREFLTRLRDSGLLYQLQGAHQRAARDFGVI